MIPTLVWLLTVLGLGLAALPLTVRVFSGLPDRGYGLARIVGIVVVGWLAYLTGMLGFTAYTGPTVGVLALVLAGGLWVAWGRTTLGLLRARWKLLVAEEVTFLALFGLATFVRAYNADIAGQEKFMDYAFVNALLRSTTLPAEDMWLSGFAMPYYYLGYLLLGLPAKIAATPGPMAYNLAVAFVFAGGFGAALTIVYAIVAAAEKTTVDGTRVSAAAYVFGLLGGALTMLVGNLVGPLELISAQGWGSDAFWDGVGVKGLRAAASGGLLPAEGGWWWRSSRVIANIPPDGITEFPYFSFLLGDLHPHYMAIPFALLVIGLATSRWLDEYAFPDLAGLLLSGVALATLIPASSWDVPTFWGLFGIAALADAWRRGPTREKLIARLPALAVPFVVAAVLVVPYFVGYQSQPLGLGIVTDRTPVISMLILFGPTLLVSGVFAAWMTVRAAPASADVMTRVGRITLIIGLLLVGLSAFGQPTMALLMAVFVALTAAGWQQVARPVGAEPERMAEEGAPPAISSSPCFPISATFCWLLTIWALCVLVGTELIFLRDVFGSRMNTVFKFHYHAWLLLGVASAAALGLIWQTRPATVGWRAAVVVVALVVLVPGLVYPLGATWTKSNGFRGEPTLMGDRFLERGAVADRAIEWLRQNAVGRPVVVEAVGGDYTDHARVSTFSGLPTLLGWVGHELQWRGERPEYGSRQQAVDAIYRATTREEIYSVADRYRVRYVFFGTLERAKYGGDAQGRLDKLLTVVFSRAGTTIYQVEPE